MKARVVSLLPSTTETLRAWGHDPIACSRFCEQPDLPTVGGTKDPDIDAIVALAPDLVVMDEEENRREDADALTAAGLTIFVTAVRSVDDVAPTLDRLATTLASRHEPVVEQRFVTESGVGKRRHSWVPIWRRPWMTINGDTYGSSVLAAIGIGNVYGADAERYPTIESLDEVAARRPDVVVAPSEPYPFAERHRAELEQAGAPDVRFVDGRDLFWWGVRTPGAIDRLRSLLS